VVVIGSGATAVTLVPALAERAAHVTMLQRSPTYVVSRPGVDRIASWLRDRLPATTAHAATRWKNVVLGTAFYEFCRRFPDRARALIRTGVEAQLGGTTDIDTHFAPSYAPWDQRLCLVPDGDLFATIKRGAASVVTDHVERFTEHGVALRSGRVLAADIIVTATGLELQFLGGATITVDGEPIVAARTWNYKGAMLSGVPNLALALGYTNASWTLKAELVCQYVCRVLDHMRRGGYRIVVPTVDDPTMASDPLLDLQSGYVQRAQGLMPQQGPRAPWRLYQNYPRDLITLRHRRVDDGVLRFRH
jgi:monooxygenase